MTVWGEGGIVPRVKKKYTIVKRRSDFVMWRFPIWETFVSGGKTKKNPWGIYTGLLITKDLFVIESYQKAKEIVKWLNDYEFLCQHKIVNVDKIPEIIKTTKGFFPKGSQHYWKNFLVDNSIFKKRKTT